MLTLVKILIHHTHTHTRTHTRTHTHTHTHTHTYTRIQTVGTQALDDNEKKTRCYCC